MKITNYQSVIDEILQSELIISGSLHGIILAEAYSIPAVLLKIDKNLKYLNMMIITWEQIALNIIL